MSLDKYVDKGDGQQKSTHINIVNPAHPDTTADYADPERMKRHFRAAKALKNSGIDRKLLVGDFLDAVHRERFQGEEGAVETYLQELADSS